MEEGRRLLFFFHIFLAFSPTSSSRPRPPCSLHGRQKRGGEGGYSRHFLIRSIITHMRKGRRRRGERRRGRRLLGGPRPGQKREESAREHHTLPPSCVVVPLGRLCTTYYVLYHHYYFLPLSSLTPFNFLNGYRISSRARWDAEAKIEREREENCVNSLRLLSPRPVANYS